MRVTKSSEGRVVLEVTRVESREIATGYVVLPDGAIRVSLTDAFAAELVRGLLDVARPSPGPTADPQGAL